MRGRDERENTRKGEGDRENGESKRERKRERNGASGRAEKGGSGNQI